MGKARYANTNTADLTTVRKDVDDFSRQMGQLTSSRSLGRVAIDDVETRIPHRGSGDIPRCLIFDIIADNGSVCHVSHTKETDLRFIYLIATTPCTAEIEVF